MTLKYEAVLGWELLCSACVTQLHFPTHTKMSAANSSYQTMISFSRQIMFCSQISTQLERISNNYLTAWSKLNGVSNLRSCHVLQFVVLSPIPITMKAAFVFKAFSFFFSSSFLRDLDASSVFLISAWFSTPIVSFRLLSLYHFSCVHRHPSIPLFPSHSICCRIQFLH